jgi:hypothetical protein
MCVKYIKKKFTVVLGLKSRVVTVGIRALGLDPEDHYNCVAAVKFLGWYAPDKGHELSRPP